MARLLTTALLAVIIQVLLLQPAAARQLLIKVAEEPGVYGLDLRLDSVVSATNSENKAVGTFKLSNPGTQPVTIGWIVYDFSFSVAYNNVGPVEEVDQQPALSTCGNTKLPTTLAPGASLNCPFASRMNIYGGDISIVAIAAKPSQRKPAAITDGMPYLAWDTVTIPSLNPKLVVDEATELNGANKKFKEVKNSGIACHDIECDESAPVTPGCPTGYCKVCGGLKAVAAKCNHIPICVGYDMESADCGYLKQAKGPQATKASFSSWVAV